MVVIGRCFGMLMNDTMFCHNYCHRRVISMTEKNFVRPKMSRMCLFFVVVVAVELGFHGAPECSRGMWIYIGGRSRSVDPRGAHEGGARAHPPRARRAPSCRLVCCLMSTSSLLVCICSKKIAPEGLIPFGLRLIFLFFETLK